MKHKLDKGFLVLGYARVRKIAQGDCDCAISSKGSKRKKHAPSERLMKQLNRASGSHTNEVVICVRNRFSHSWTVNHSQPAQQA